MNAHDGTRQQNPSSKFTCSDTISGMPILQVHVVANAKVDSVVGEHGGAIKIKLRAPAVEGRANAALIDFLVKQLKLPRHSIVLERSERSRNKLIRIDGLMEEDVHRRLLRKHRNESTPIQ